jgi:imidazolonepropionase-like amidohydrolase
LIRTHRSFRNISHFSNRDALTLQKLYVLACTALVAVMPHVSLSQQTHDTLSYVVLNHGRPTGSMDIAGVGDSVVVRFQYVDRNRGPRVATTYHLNSIGAISRMEARGLGTDFFQKEIGEHFWSEGNTSHYKSDSDSGDVVRNDSAFYRAVTPTPYDNALLARFLLRHDGRPGRIAPAGFATAKVLIDTTVSAGAQSQHIRFVSIAGLDDYPTGVWLDDNDQLFSSASEWFVTVRRGWESVLPSLRASEYSRTVARSAALAKRLAPAPSSTIIVRNGNVFDSESGTLKPNTSVLVKGDRIVAVGPAASIKTPAGATVIDAAGQTVIPGMWDMHTHLDFTGEEDGVLQLASGITTVRDMASNIDDAVSRRARADAGNILAPREILAGFMDGPGAWAGPTEILVSTPEQARHWIAVYDSLGYKQIKVYNLIHPDLIPAIAAEAHRRGMRLSGHVARGLSVPAAVTLGYDEIQHAAFLFSTFYEDSLFVPKMRSYGQVAAAVAPHFNVDGPEMTSLIAFLRDHHTVIDGTFNAWLSRGAPLSDGTDMVFGPSLNWLPPVMKRELTSPPTLDPQERATEKLRDDAYMRLLKRLFDGGVTLVPGTDNVGGITYNGELEIYQRAGIPGATVLQIATIVPARVMKEDADYGSIAPGKVADLIIVNGNPVEKISDLRRIDRVMRAGRVYKASDLYSAIGVTRH